MLLLDALQASDTALNLGRERLDIAGRLANKVTKTVLDQGDEAGVLGEDGSGSDTFQILCEERLARQDHVDTITISISIITAITVTIPWSVGQMEWIRLGSEQKATDY